MFVPPREPSSAHQGPNGQDAIKPMSFFGAVLWSMAAVLVFSLCVELLAALRESVRRDQVALVLCQAAAYGLVLFGILRVYGPDKPIREVVALRGTHPAFYPLAIVMGASAQIPGSWMVQQIERRWPSEVRAFETLLELFYEAPMAERIAMAAAMVLVGPLVEELIFRGALFSPLAKRHGSAAVVAMTAALFALVHPDPRTVLPIFVMALLLGYLRAASGSLWPALLMHVAFNAVPVAELFASQPPAPGEALDETIPLGLLAGGTAVTLLALAGAALVARRSASARRARELDAVA